MVGPKSEDEDAARMAQFVKTRDRAVFEVLFQRYKRPIFAHTLRFVRVAARAEELTQDVFVRVYTTKRYEPATRFRTWLYTVATHVCLNELRRSEYRQSLESLDGPASETAVSGAASPEEALAGRELQRTLEDALARLPTKQRAALLMARQDGLAHEEIAEALETSVPSVKSLIDRALETLRKEAHRHVGEASQEATL